MATSQQFISASFERAKGWLRRPGSPLLRGAGFESSRYLTKWLLLSTLIGLVAGPGGHRLLPGD